MNNITYTECNGIFYPDLALPEQTNYSLGKYARLRLDFMRRHRKATYNMLVGECRLNSYLHDIDEQAKAILEEGTTRLADERGIDETLKDRDSLKWVAEMNNIKECIEAIILRDMIFV